MDILSIIDKKKNAYELSYDELSFAFNGYMDNKVTDYQMSALLMAICLVGASLEEILSLTDIFIQSGDAYDLASVIPFTVDKHSTGGVGDTTTLVIGPMCAALGLHMAKMSGRGLGLTGGTIDKLESIPGFNVQLSEEEFYGNAQNIGIAVSSQTSSLVPMDKKIYALRDVTGTTESIPLIASSIMSKKIAAGADNILIDVKYGSGALMKDKGDAQKLAEVCETIGNAYNKNVRTILSDMSTPLSSKIGNAIEVCEAIEVLKGKKCALYDTCIDIVANLLNMAKEIDLEAARDAAIRVIDNGTALKKFFEFVKAQGGNLSEVYVSDKKIEVKAKRDGIITKIDALGVAKLASKIGCSKKTLDDTIDYSVGIELVKNINDEVKKDETIMILYVNNFDTKFDESDFDFLRIN